MSKITIFGASGYLGGHLSLQLQQRGHDVTGVYRRPPNDPLGVLGKLHSCVKADVCDSTSLKQIVRSVPDVIIYLVSLNHKACDAKYADTINTNVLPIFELGRALQEVSTKTLLVYMSTLQVYGAYKPGDVLSENLTPEPTNTYGLTHLMCEHTVRVLRHKTGVSHFSIRLSNGCGPPAFPSCDCNWLVINDFCLSAVRNHKVVLASDGSPQRDFLDVNDIATAVDSLIDSRGPFPPVVNLASGTTRTMLELAHLVASSAKQMFGHHVPVLLPGGEESYSVVRPPKKFEVSTDLLYSVIPRFDQTSLHKSIRQTLEYYSRDVRHTY